MAESARSNSSAPRHGGLSRSLPPGSPRHLALLFTDERPQTAVEGLYAFEAELRRIVDSHSHEAAHARLRWWRAELDRLAGGRPTHPLGTALLSLRARGFDDWGLLHELVVAADLDLARFTYHDWSELDAYCDRAAGALQTAVAILLADGRPLEDRERAYVSRLGRGLRQAEMLRDLRIDAVRGRLYAPLEALNSAGIDPVSFGHGDDGPAARSFLHRWRDRVREHLTELDSLLGRPDLRRIHRHGLVLAAVHLRLLDRLGAWPHRNSPRIDLEPLARLWTAWRTAVRHL